MYPVEQAEQLTLFPPGTREHASLLVMPGSEKARKTTVTSGRKCSVLYKPSTLGGLLVRMLLGTSHWGSTLCYLTWTVSDTPQKRLYFRLVPSTPDTDETEYLLWPTPKASVRGDCPSERRRNTPDLHSAVKMWSTPTACEWKGRGPNSKQQGLTNQIGCTGAQLNPAWVEKLMGFPEGWTDIGETTGKKELQESLLASKTG